MRIDQSRQQRVARTIDHARIGGLGLHRIAATRSEYLSVLDQQCLEALQPACGIQGVAVDLVQQQCVCPQGGRDAQTGQRAKDSAHQAHGKVSADFGEAIICANALATFDQFAATSANGQADLNASCDSHIPGTPGSRHVAQPCTRLDSNPRRDAPASVRTDLRTLRKL